MSTDPRLIVACIALLAAPANAQPVAAAVSADGQYTTALKICRAQSLPGGGTTTWVIWERGFENCRRILDYQARLDALALAASLKAEQAKRYEATAADRAIVDAVAAALPK